ncbi:MAG: thioesterase family protein [Acidobacteria bacterium]|nr:thioesterase family protein [Acidobacteriota bacterium]
MKFRTEVRVRYHETDAMGIAHHSSHLVWFEIGRTELMRARGISYAELEREKIFLPVVEVACRYHLPVRYDDQVLVETEVAELGAARIRFSYRVLRLKDEKLIATGSTLHAALNGRGTVTRLPAKIREVLSS